MAIIQPSSRKLSRFRKFRGAYQSALLPAPLPLRGGVSKEGTAAPSLCRLKGRSRRGISVLAHRCGDTIPGPYWGRQSCRCLENQLASSAAGGASLIFPLLDLPFKRPKEGAAAPSLETPPTERQRKEKQGVSTSTPGGKPRYNLRLEGWMIAKVQRTWMRPGGFYPVVAFKRPHPQTCLYRQVWTKSVFLLDRARPVFFGKTKENGGCISDCGPKWVP